MALMGVVEFAVDEVVNVIACGRGFENLKIAYNKSLNMGKAGAFCTPVSSVIGHPYDPVECREN